MATLGVALLLASSDVCLLATCAPAQAGDVVHCLVRSDCATTQGHHDAAGRFARPHCLSYTTTAPPQIVPPAATASVPPGPAIPTAIVRVHVPENLASAPADGGPSPPAPSFLDATGVRAPPQS